MCKLQSKCWGWNLDQHSQAFAQSPTPTISITAYPNPTSFLDLIQYKFIFSSKVFKSVIGEEGLVLLKTNKKMKQFLFFQDKCKVKENKNQFRKCYFLKTNRWDTCAFCCFFILFFWSLRRIWYNLGRKENISAWPMPPKTYAHIHVSFFLKGVRVCLWVITSLKKTRKRECMPTTFYSLLLNGIQKAEEEFLPPSYFCLWIPSLFFP